MHVKYLWLKTNANKLKYGANPVSLILFFFFNIYMYIYFFIGIDIVQNSLNNIHPVPLSLSFFFFKSSAERLLSWPGSRTTILFEATAIYYIGMSDLAYEINHSISKNEYVKCMAWGVNSDQLYARMHVEGVQGSHWRKLENLSDIKADYRDEEQVCNSAIHSFRFLSPCFYAESLSHE